ncbi:large conductance mechanosensitive channel protein MscL [Amylolactobacillus amylophilus]|uniref:large conductance mechanosensitive channel protein MscL n=1 Tax=Amylolactobacillus amylophilus TaxID=1603 RepID=UPI0006D22E99|nr:large conductance mechanosensitive channel protein MscL [Amylolactobacillus amylophilus]
MELFGKKRSSQNQKQAQIDSAIGEKSVHVFNDFRDFLATGNIVNFAVGFLVGNALSKVIQAFITDLFDPIISKITGKSVLLVNQKLVLGQGQIVISWGHFISQLINFLITAIAVYIVIRAMQKTIMKQDAAGALTGDEIQAQILRELQLNNRMMRRNLELNRREEELRTLKADIKKTRRYSRRERAFRRSETLA